MYYYKARIYSPTLGRFLQTDPIGYKDQINLYAYVGNDPVNKVDPTGMYGCGETMSRGECEQFKKAQDLQISRLSKALSSIASVKAKLDDGKQLSRSEQAVVDRVGRYLGKANANSAGLGRVLTVGRSALADLKGDSKKADIGTNMGSHDMTSKPLGAGIWINRRVFDTNRGWNSLPHEGVHTGTDNYIRDVNWGGERGAYNEEMKLRAAVTRPHQAVMNADSWVSAMGVD